MQQFFFPLRLSWRHDFTRELSFEADGSRWFEGLRPQGWCEAEQDPTLRRRSHLMKHKGDKMEATPTKSELMKAPASRWRWWLCRCCWLPVRDSGRHQGYVCWEVLVSGLISCCKTAKLKDFFTGKSCTQVWAELASSSRGRAEKAWTTVPAQAEEGKKHGETQCVRRVSHVSCWKNLPSKNLDSILNGTRGDTMCQHSLVVCGS